MYTLPNLLTLSRLLLAPVVAWRLLAHDVEGAFWLFVLAAITDLLDGNLARWLNQRSVLGAWLDPIADKVMLLTTFAMLALTGLLPMWLLYLVLADVALDLGLAAQMHTLVLLTAAAAALSGLRYVWIWSRKTRDFFARAFARLAHRSNRAWHRFDIN